MMTPPKWLQTLFRRPADVLQPQATGPAAKDDEQVSSPNAFPPDALIVDVRSSAEFETGHVEGALLLPLDQLQAGIAALAPRKTTPLVLYCRSGARSEMGCGILSQMGYLHVRNGGAAGTLAIRLARRIVREPSA